MFNVKLAPCTLPSQVLNEFRVYLKVFGQQQLAGPEEAEDVTENLSVPVDEIVLLQTVQHDGLGAVKETTDPEN